MKKLLTTLVWVAVALLGAGALAKIALQRGESLNAIWFVLAAACCYMVAYRVYSAFVAARILTLDDTRATPAERHDDGRDFVPTNKWVLFGHHFAAIAGPGPLVGPTLAAQFGYLPGTLWLIAGAVLAGCVQDFVILFCSIRRDGKSLGEMAREEVSRRGGFLAQLAVLAILVILLGVVALVVVNALKSSPWATFTLAMTIPIAMLLGVYLRFFRRGRVLEASLIGVALVLFVVVAGQWVAESASWSRVFHAQRDFADDRDHSVRVRGVGPAGMAAAGAARLSQRLHQGGRDLFAGGGHSAGAAQRADAAAHAVHRRQRAGFRGEDLSVLLYHHCVRRDQRISLPDFLGHDAQDDPARKLMRGSSATERCCWSRSSA